MFRGSCLCESIRYEVRGSLSHVTHCHCSMCRKAHGAAFATYARVEAGDFVVTSGAADIVSYQSSPQVTRTFCKTCGSTLQFIYTDRPGSLWLALGTLDGGSGVRVEQHIFVGSKAPWLDITDDLPQRIAYQ